jgi:hypothetical protein
MATRPRLYFSKKTIVTDLLQEPALGVVRPCLRRLGGRNRRLPATRAERGALDLSPPFDVQ